MLPEHRTGDRANDGLRTRKGPDPKTAANPSALRGGATEGLAKLAEQRRHFVIKQLTGLGEP